MNKYVVSCVKDIGVIMEGKMHIEADSRRKCRKSFRKAHPNWQIVSIKTKEIDGIVAPPEHILAIDRDILT
jgi:hypothetical protein